MMIEKRLIGTVKESKKYIAGNVIFQWISLTATIVMMISVTTLFEMLLTGRNIDTTLVLVITAVLAVLLVKAVCAVLSSQMSYQASKAVKATLREKIHQKLLHLGSGYRESVNTSEVVQVAVEGVEQLETYFGSYLPQFFYAMLAPITLFCVLAWVNLPSAAVLLICVPLIPVSIALVQTWAKKLLSKYWGQYAALGDTFLENLQGLTTLKIYQTDQFKQEEMNRESEKFRRITMKVLTMQLNSITIMDLIAYGGAAVGVIMAVTQFTAGRVDVAGCLLIILLSADFFLPMRLLGSFFHIAMNGMAASGKIFRLLDLPEEEGGRETCTAGNLVLDEVHFSYHKKQEVLCGVSLTAEQGKFTAIVGESGCGKSTAAAILMGRNKNYSGSVSLAGTELSAISEESRMQHITYIGHNSYLFKGTVRENLNMANREAADSELWAVLERTKLAAFLRSENGLDTVVAEKGGNFSGGQCQRLALARALLHNSSVYIFDEATSNIDAESENDLMEEIRSLAKIKTVLLISHRLVNVVEADRIYVMEKGRVVENGSHAALLQKGGCYARLWNTQQELEHYGKKVK